MTAHGSVQIGHRTLSYAVVRSARARSLRLRMGPQAIVTIVVPRHHRLGPVDEILRPHHRWIVKQLDRLTTETLPDWQPISGAVIPYLGSEFVLRIVASKGPFAGTVGVDGELELHVESSADSVVRAGLERWYRDEARALLTVRAEHWAAILGTHYGRISIRNQRTRWGSCSSVGNLNFNWRLIMAPVAVIDYVVIHELAHLAVPNHRPRFWRYVESYSPDRRQHQAWLRNHAPRLAQILPH